MVSLCNLLLTNAMAHRLVHHQFLLTLHPLLVDGHHAEHLVVEPVERAGG